jgi:undecaprenyl diphosphate synthase
MFDATPRHIAFIMDGNGRWAKSRFLPRVAGHAKGALTTKQLIKTCADRGIAMVTLYAFSTENWARPADEVSALMGLFLKYLQSEITGMIKNGVRLKILGDLQAFSPTLREAIAAAEIATANGQRIQVNVAANYGGRLELLSAMQAWLRANPGAPPEALSASALEAHLLTAGMPEPDLLIRTGGECRLSNFLLWQSAYTELYFTPTLWPDFGAKALDQALTWYSQRERRFGKTSEQVAKIQGA